jgi:hypothetical protein
MAKELKILKEHNPTLHDSATGMSCITEKVVDVTEDCPNASEKKRVVFLYTRDRNGRIIQMARPYEGEEYMGVHINFHVDQLEGEMTVAPRDDRFGSWATKLGLDKAALRTLIETHAPTA